MNEDASMPWFPKLSVACCVSRYLIIVNSGQLSCIATINMGEEQEQELEVLKAIFMDDLTGS